MKYRSFLLLMLAGLVSTPALADQVTCESVNGGRTECDMNTRGEVRLVRQLSKTTCIEDTNWGLNRSSIWVDGGCRGVFASGDSLNAGYGGSSSHGGAAAGSGGLNQVTCESLNGARTECDMNTRGRVRVMRQLSKTTCIEDTNWGLNRSSIWVDGGCRAVFVNESAGSSGGPSGGSSRPVPEEPTPAHIAACNSRMPGEGDVESFEPLMPGAWSIILSYRGQRFACDVDGQGRVNGFQQLN